MERKLATKFFIKRQRRKRRKLISLAILFLLIIVLYILVNYLIKSISNKSFNLMDPFISSDSKINNDDIKEIKNPLGDVVNTALAGTQGDYAVAIKNLKTGESYFLNETKSYEAGSLYKLWVMAEVYKQIQEGILTREELLEDTIVNLNRKFNLSAEDAELTSGTIGMTVKQAITQMITISHNYAAMLLVDKIKLSSIENFLKINGLNTSIIGNGTPSTTASDTALFYEKLYKGELADLTHTTEMLDILKAQTFDGGLPKYLPEQTIIANKTGDIGWYKHDAGIIFSEKGDYIIVVMSKSDSPAGAQDRIALISKAVYEYFTK